MYGKIGEVKEDREKGAKAMAAFKVPQIKKPAKITQAARAQARMQPTRTAAVFVYNPHLRYISQNLHGRKKLFPEKNSCLGVLMVPHHKSIFCNFISMLRIFSNQTFLPPAGSCWAKTLFFHLLVFAVCCSIHRACNPSSWILIKFYLPFNKNLLAYVTVCLSSSKATPMSPFPNAF